MSSLESDIEKIIKQEILALNRFDLAREPLVSYSQADDPRYLELKTIIGDWHLTPKEMLTDAESVISYFVPFTKEVVLSPKESKAESAIWGESYVVINEYFAHINNVICSYLEEAGYSAHTIPATHTYNPKDMKSMWSHRSAAAIAGLGTFGANRMLITEKGSGGRFCTVLTSAPLKCKKHAPVNRCSYINNGSCGLCFEICPADALRPDKINRFACQAETIKNGKSLEAMNLHNADTCGKCISICPFAYIE